MVRAGTELVNATLLSFAPKTPPETDGEKTGYGPRPLSPEIFTGKDFRARFAAWLLSFLGDFPPRISLSPPLASPLHVRPCALSGRTLGLPSGQCGASAPKSGGSTPISGVHVCAGAGEGGFIWGHCTGRGREKMAEPPETTSPRVPCGRRRSPWQRRRPVGRRGR